MTATGIHQLDLAVALLGPAERAFASVRRLGSDLANGDTLGALVTFRSGANLLLSAILATPFAGRFAVYGNQGWAEVRDKAHPEAPEGWVLTTCRRGGGPVIDDYPAAPAVRAQPRGLCRCRRGPRALSRAAIPDDRHHCRARGSSAPPPAARSSWSRPRHRARAPRAARPRAGRRPSKARCWRPDTMPRPR